MNVRLKLLGKRELLFVYFFATNARMLYSVFPFYFICFPFSVLISMILDEVKAFNCIRFSLSKFTTEDEPKITVESVKKRLKNLGVL